MKIAFVVLVVIVAGACGPAGTAVSSATASPSASATAATTPSSAMPVPTAQILVAGRVVSADVAAEQSFFFPSGASLYAVSTREGPAPYDSKIQRFDPTSHAWTDVFEDDAMFNGLRTAGTRAAIVEYRETPMSGGASDDRVAVLDLTTGALTGLDAFALSAKTYHGGGGGPRRPSASIAIGDDVVAWTRLNELDGGVVEGELRVAALSASGSFTTIGRSREWIMPLSVDATSLLYVVGGATRDDVRLLDLRTGEERSVATLAAPGQSDAPRGIARSGDVLGWIENPSQTSAAGPRTSLLRTVDLATGATRDLDLAPAAYCVGLSANALGFVWDCFGKPAPTSVSYFDPRAWRRVEVLRSNAMPNSAEAFASGFLWFDKPATDGRRVNALFLR